MGIKKSILGVCISLALASSLFTGTALAATTTPTAEKKVLTMDEAISKAKKNNMSLDSLADSISNLEENRKDIIAVSGLTGGSSGSTGGNVAIYDAAHFATLSGINQMNSGEKTARLSKEIVEAGIPLAVKSQFSTILNTEKEIALLTETLRLQKETLKNAGIRVELGMMSKQELEKLQVATKQMEGNLQVLKLSLDQAYINLNSLLGLPATDRYQVVYDVEYAPLKLNTEIGTYIHGKLAQDQSLEMLAIAKDDAYLATYMLAKAPTATEYRGTQLAYAEKERSYADAKKKKATNIQNTYLQIQQLENNRQNLEQDLSKAELEYNAAKVGYQVGNITKLTLDQAALAVEKAKNDLDKNTKSHDILLYTFGNVCLITDK